MRWSVELYADCPTFSISWTFGSTSWCMNLNKISTPSVLFLLLPFVYLICTTVVLPPRQEKRDRGSIFLWHQGAVPERLLQAFNLSVVQTAVLGCLCCMCCVYRLIFNHSSCCPTMEHLLPGLPLLYVICLSCSCKM